MSREHSGEADGTVGFETDSEGVIVSDPIERRRVVLSTPETDTLKSAATDNFRFPVDAAVSFRAEALSLSTVVTINVRDSSGTVLAQVEQTATESLPENHYTIELSTPIKLYIQVESSVTVDSSKNSTAEKQTIDFGNATEVVVGARSHHDHPATTVTTTTDPEDMMQAVSTFGSALKTTSAERSYPTLRGHPPMVEVDDELDLAGLEPPDTGVTIEIPPEYRSIFVVSPLAYYLGARVVPGKKPLLRTDEGFEYELNGPVGFERTVERTLKQTFFLDCLTRTEGLSPVDLHERRALDGELDIDFAALYDSSLSEQLETYLSIPFSVLESHIPKWKLTTHVEPVPNNIKMLPFVVDDLANVRSTQAQEISVKNITKAIHSELSGPVRSTNADSSDIPSYVQPEMSGSAEQAWVGEGTPLGANKATIEAYRNSLERTPTEGGIDITVVCNETEMGDEQEIIDDIYGERTYLSFSITAHHDLTIAELRDVLATPTDFFHYIGHIDSEGIQCADGKLDAQTLDSVGVDSFLLNGCQSYQQGMALIERGAIGGIVTLSDVLNRDAVGLGGVFAGLLNCGFPLTAAIEVASEESSGNRYASIGDGGFALTQAESGTPNLCTIERTGDSFRVEQRTYPTNTTGLGSLYNPYINTNNEFHLAAGTVKTFELSQAEIKEFLELETIPVKIDGNLYWSDNLNLEEHY